MKDKFDNDIRNSLDKISPNEGDKRRIFNKISDNMYKEKRSIYTYKWLSVGVLASLVLVIGGFAINNILQTKPSETTLGYNSDDATMEIARYYHYTTLKIKYNSELLTYANADPFKTEKIATSNAKTLGKGILISDHDTPQKLETDVYYVESKFNASQKELPIIVQAKSIENDTSYNAFVLLRTDFKPYEETDKFKEVSDFYGGFSYILRHEEKHGDDENGSVSMAEIKLDSDKINEILNKSYTKNPTLVPHEYNLTGENLEFKINLGIFSDTDINCSFTGRLYKDGYFQLLYRDMNLIFYISQENAEEIFDGIENKTLF